MFVFLRDSLPSPDKYSSPTDCLFCASLPPNFLPHEEDKPKAKCWIPGNLQGEHSTSEQSASSHPWYSAVGHYIIYFFLQSYTAPMWLFFCPQSPARLLLKEVLRVGLPNLCSLHVKNSCLCGLPAVRQGFMRMKRETPSPCVLSLE